MDNYIKTYWKKALFIGRERHLHYLEKQRISILNAILVLVIAAALLMTLVYYYLNFEFKNIGLIVLPVCLFSLWCNYKLKHTFAKHVAFFGILASITIWCYFTRNTGAHYFYITLGCGVASIYSEKRTIFITMIIAALFFKAYVLWNYFTPFVPIPNLNYQLLNFMLIYVASAIIFFQIMVHLDINRKISKSHDKQLYEKNEAIKTLKITEDKLKESNNQLLAFNNKLDKLVKKSSEELYSFQAAINDNLFSIVTDLEGRIVKINNNYLEKSKFSKNEIVGKHISIIQSDFHSNTFYESINKTIYAGKVWRGESKIKTKDGSDFWLISSIMPIKNSSGLIKSFLTVAADITDKKIAVEKEKKALQNLNQTQEKLALILQNLTDLVVITDKSGNRKYVNTAFCDFFDKDESFFIGTNYKTQFPEKISEAYLNLFDSISIDNPKITFMDLVINFKNEGRWIIWNEMAVFDDNNEITEIFSIGHDVTEIKEIEFQNANFIAQFEEIAFKTSHNFRGPLSNIISLINMLNEDGFEENEIKQVGTYLSTAVNNLDIASRELASFVERYNIQKMNADQSTNVDAFQNAKSKHLNWKFKVRNYIDGIGSMTQQEATLPTHSELGKWYFSEGKSIFGHMVSMQEFETKNQKLHLLVKEILILKSLEEHNQKEQKFLELNAVSDSILLLLEQAESEILKLVAKN